VRLRTWLESEVEDAGTRMLFVGVRRSLNRIAADVGLLAEVARRLRSLDRWEGRARMMEELKVSVNRLKFEIRFYRCYT
jgi:hypothetical protein